MRSGVELALYNKFCELLMKHNNPKWAVDELDYLVFCKECDSEYREQNTVIFWIHIHCKD